VDPRQRPRAHVRDYPIQHRWRAFPAVRMMAAGGRRGPPGRQVMPDSAAGAPQWCTRRWSVSDCDGSCVTSTIRAASPALGKGKKRCARGRSQDDTGNSAAMSRCGVGGDRNVRFSRPSLPAAERQEPA